MKFYQKVVLLVFTVLCIGLVCVSLSGCTETQWSPQRPHQHECKPDYPAREAIDQNRERIIQNHKQIEKNRKQLKGFERSNYDKRFTYPNMDKWSALVWPVPFPTPLPRPENPKPVPTFKIFLC